MGIALIVASGEEEGRLIALGANQTRILGRDLPSDEQFPFDSFMSDKHFEVRATTSGCVIRDLGSRNGVFVSGERVTEQALLPGMRFRAGATEFVVTQMDDANSSAPPNAVQPVTLPRFQMSEEGRSSLKALEPQSGSNLYAVMDAAQDSLIPSLLAVSGEQFRSLYEGKQAQELASVAPYLVRLPTDSMLLPILIERGWAANWGIYLHATAEFDALRRHLRRFLLVQLENGERVYFRFYDPRVLESFLPTCTPQEAKQFCGPVEKYLVPAELGKLVVFTSAAP